MILPGQPWVVIIVGTPCSAPPPLAGDTLLPCLRIVEETFVVVAVVKNDDDAVFGLLLIISRALPPIIICCAYPHIGGGIIPTPYWGCCCGCWCCCCCRVLACLYNEFKRSRDCFLRRTTEIVAELDYCCRRDVLLLLPGFGARIMAHRRRVDARGRGGLMTSIRVSSGAGCVSNRR